MITCTDRQSSTSCAVVIILGAREEFSKVARREVSLEALEAHPEVSCSQSRERVSRAEKRRER